MAKQTFFRSGSLIEKQAGVLAHTNPKLNKLKRTMAIFIKSLLWI
jgi:hypothetical protein